MVKNRTTESENSLEVIASFDSTVQPRQEIILRGPPEDFSDLRVGEIYEIIVQSTTTS